MKHLPVTALALASLGIVASSSSCSTARGFGQDLRKLGGRIEHQADETGGAVPDPAPYRRTTTTTYTTPAYTAPTYTTPAPSYTTPSYSTPRYTTPAPPQISTTPPGY